ncbi:MAG: hypothetical protein AAF663_06120 [Planctomycetota bacterium]
MIESSSFAKAGSRLATIEHRQTNQAMLRYGHSRNAAIRDLLPLADFPKAQTPKPRYAALTTKYAAPNHTSGAAHQPNVNGAATQSDPNNAKAKPYFTLWPSA